MSVVSNNILAGASGQGATGYEIERSLRFDDAADSHLSKTFATAGNRKKWTLSFWTKRTGLGTEDNLFTASGNYIRFEPSDVMRLNNGSIVDSTRVFRDPSAWYHVVWVWDTAQATASDRSKVYVNNEIVTFSGYPAQDADSTVNNNVQHIIGAQGTGVSSHGYDGYIADMHFIDGQALAPTDFGETDTNGVWQPKKFVGTYTTHTVPVYNSTYGSDITSTEVAKTIDGDIATYGVPTGDFVGYTYSNTNDPIINIKWENTKGSAITVYIQPWVSGGAANAGTFASSGANSVTIAAGATLETTFTFPAGYDGYFRIYASGDGTNLRIYDVGGVARAFNSFYLPFSDNSASTQLGLDYSQGTAGTNNKGMEVVTYAGSGGTQSIDNLAFQPDFVWIKNRTIGYSHLLYDVIRGAGSGKALASNTTDAEGDLADASTYGYLDSFDANGFSVVQGASSNSYTNGPSQNYVAWCWKAGGAAVSNTDGTITSQVSANNTYGFSIAKYTGTGANATFGHGLSSAPKFILVKKLTAASWNVYHTGIGATKTLELNGNGAVATAASWANTAPTSSVVSVGNYPDTNDSGGNYIAYSWSEVAGFSKFGSYTGTGAAGTQIDVGFKPAFVLVKNTTSANDWIIVDKARTASVGLWANSAGTESAQGSITAITSNGFTLGAGGEANVSGSTYIYAAFAANPANDWDVNNLSVASNIFSQTASGQNWMQYKATYNNNTVAQTKTGSRYRIALDDLFSGINDSTNYSGTQIFGITNFNAQGFIHNSLVSSDGTATTGFANSNDAGSIWKGYFNYPTNSGKYASIAMYDGSATDGTDFPVDRSDNDSLVDTPTNGTQVDTGAGGEVVGNYATLNPLTLPGGGTLSNGNLKFSSGGDWDPTSATIGVSSGKWYWEYMFEGTNMESGITAHPNTENWIGNYQGSVGIGNYSEKYVNGTTSNPSGWSTIATGSIVGNELDLDNGTFRHYVNGVVAPSYATESLDTSLTWFPAGSVYGSSSLTYNFGQRPFAYTAPSGYKALCTANLPDPTIKDGSKYFDTKLFTGNGGTQSITGYNFSPDFAWIKNRSAAASNNLVDTVRGVNKVLFSDNTGTENTDTNRLTAFNSDGFDVGSNNAVNGNGNGIVSWAWDAGSSNTTIAVGGLNSSFYNQGSTNYTTSQVTGDDFTTAFGTTGGMFDGSKTTIRAASSQNTFTWTTSIALTTLRLMVHKEGGTTSINITDSNGQRNIASLFPTTSNSDVTNGNLTFVNVPVSGTLTEIEVNADPSGVGYQAGIAMVEVDGKVLIDNGVTPTNVPSIASTVRANPSAGFSIVSFTDGGSACTVGHGLNSAPEMYIVKFRGATGNWAVYHKSIGNDHRLKLNLTDAKQSGNDWWNATSPTSSVFSLGSNLVTSTTQVAYCFAPVEGYSAFGTYTGNGSADGPFVTTGFRPRWIMIKSSSNGGTGWDWHIYDSERDPSNVMSKFLDPNTSQIEQTRSDGANYTDMYVDFVSNGFKLRNAYASPNASGATFIYAAFAEHPFKTARAR